MTRAVQDLRRRKDHAEVIGLIEDVERELRESEHRSIENLCDGLSRERLV
jgi:hypothetical protein